MHKLLRNYHNAKAVIPKRLIIVMHKNIFQAFIAGFSILSDVLIQTTFS